MSRATRERIVLLDLPSGAPAVRGFRKAGSKNLMPFHLNIPAKHSRNVGSFPYGVGLGGAPGTFFRPEKVPWLEAEYDGAQPQFLRFDIEASEGRVTVAGGIITMDRR